MSYSIESVKRVICLCANSIAEHKDVLEETDSRTGDGDLGISMKKGFLALLEEADKYTGTDIGKFFGNCAMALNRAAPSTMGTLLSSGLMQCMKKFAGISEIDDAAVFDIPNIFAEAISARGRAIEGDRTILDALIPMGKAFKKAEKEGLGLPIAVQAGFAAASEGAERTKGLVPKMGRAKWAPANAVGIVDGGALLCKIVAKALCDEYAKE